MKKNLMLAVLSLLVVFGLDPKPGLAGIEAILGKWLIKAETPNGPLEIEFDLKQEGNQLVGTAALMQGVVPLSAVKYEEPNLTAELALGGNSYRMLGTLKEGKFTGTWEQIGGDVKGTWTAERRATPPTSGTAASGISGSWNSISVTPNGELALGLDLIQDGEKVTGSLSSERGSVPLQAATFKDNKLQFDVDLGGTVYRVEGTLKENRFDGKWYPVAGGEGGTWNATRKTAVPVPAGAPPQPVTAPAVIEGTWQSTAVTPDGDLPFQVVFKQADGVLSGQIIESDGTLTLKKVTFADSKLSFEVDYMGGTYRIDATLADGKLSGKWSSVSGSETGTWSAVRKP